MPGAGRAYDSALERPLRPVAALLSTARSDVLSGFARSSPGRPGTFRAPRWPVSSPGFALRPPRPHDAEAIVEMMNEESLALRGAAMVSLDWIANAWTVGSVALGRHGRGIGAAILAEMGRRAARFPPLASPGERVVIHAGALADEPRVAELLTAHGYFEARRFAQMSIELDEPPPPAAIPGIEIRRLRPRDERAAYQCLSEAFADHWGGNWPTEDVWRHDHIDSSSAFAPELWHLAWDGTELAGVLIADPEADDDPRLGHVSNVGVRRAYRRRGIGEALLRTSFAQFYERGSAGVVLEVDTESITGATRLYERMGMTATPRFSQWEKELRPGACAVRSR